MRIRDLYEIPNDERHLWDVFAVTIKGGERRLMQAKMTERNAEAFILMAIGRRGVETEFYTKEPHTPAKRMAAK